VRKYFSEIAIPDDLKDEIRQKKGLRTYESYLRGLMKTEEQVA